MRIAVVAVGAALTGVGIVLLAGMLTTPQLLGLGAWLAAAVLLHDGVWMPLVTAAARAGSWGRRTPHRRTR
ncbi:hypothetical protein [Sinomonas mesophila]|uniref:hypothetical protein n=1 Tax=Sinomonas mesophila TaxID=1531955 RepID=UPI000986EC6F|nr:hypothetical protein [Sinomonas mesophila]